MSNRESGQTRSYAWLPDNALVSVNTRVSGDSADRLHFAYTYDNDSNIRSRSCC